MPETPAHQSGKFGPTESTSGWREKNPDDIDTTPEDQKPAAGRRRRSTRKRPSGIPADSDDPDSSPTYNSRQGRPVRYRPPANRRLFSRQTPNLPIAGVGITPGPSTDSPPQTPEEQAIAAGNKRQRERGSTPLAPRANRRRVDEAGRQTYDDPTSPPRGGTAAPATPTQWIHDDDMDKERQDSDEEEHPSPNAARAARKILRPTGTRNTAGILDRQALLAKAREEREKVSQLTSAFGGMSVNRMDLDWQPETSARPDPPRVPVQLPQIDWDAPIDQEPMVIDDAPPPLAKMLRLWQKAKDRLGLKDSQTERSQQQVDDELTRTGTEEQRFQSQSTPDQSTSSGRTYHPYRPLVNQGINRHSPQASRNRASAGGYAPAPPSSSASSSQPGPSRNPTLRCMTGNANLAASYQYKAPSPDWAQRQRQSFVIEENNASGVSNLYYNKPDLHRTGHVKRIKFGAGHIFSGRFRRHGGENFIMAFPYDIRFLIYKELLTCHARLIKLGAGAPLITVGMDIPPCDNQIMFTSKTIHLETFRIFYGINTFEIKVNWEHFLDPLHFLPADFGLAVRKINLVHDFKINSNLREVLARMNDIPCYHYPSGPSTRILDFNSWAPILQRLDYLHVEWKVETWVRHRLYAGADLNKTRLTKKDGWEGWDGIWFAMQMYKTTQKAGSQRTSSYFCYWDSWMDPRFGMDLGSYHTCGARCKYMEDFFAKLWETDVGADFDRNDLVREDPDSEF